MRKIDYGGLNVYSNTKYKKSKAVVSKNNNPSKINEVIRKIVVLDNTPVKRKDAVKSKIFLKKDEPVVKKSLMKTKSTKTKSTEKKNALDILSDRLKKLR